MLPLIQQMAEVAVHHPTSSEFTAHFSEQDASVNWDLTVDVGRLEARYVRRCPDYFVVYLSSQTGCVQACRMCHLTASEQTRIRDATFAEMIEQAETVLDYYRRLSGENKGSGVIPSEVTKPTEAELAALRRSVARSRPYGDESWTSSTATALGLESTLHRRGRPPLDKARHESLTGYDLT